VITPTSSEAAELGELDLAIKDVEMTEPPRTPRKLFPTLAIGTPKKADPSCPLSMASMRSNILGNMENCKKPWGLFEDERLEKERKEVKDAFWGKSVENLGTPLESQGDKVEAPPCSAFQGPNGKEVICLFHGQVSKSGTIELAQCKLPCGEPPSD
jgi:hypothetical protein